MGKPVSYDVVWAFLIAKKPIVGLVSELNCGARLRAFPAGALSDIDERIPLYRHARPVVILPGAIAELASDNVHVVVSFWVGMETMMHLFMFDNDKGGH
jgi:hypothetical protein